MINMEKLTINQWAEEDRPRKKMMLKGAEALSDAELLAILIGSGNTEESAVSSLMQRVLLHLRQTTSINWVNGKGDSFSFKGFLPAKSITPSWQHWNWVNASKLQERPERATIRLLFSKDSPRCPFTRFFATCYHEEFWVLP